MCSLGIKVILEITNPHLADRFNSYIHSVPGLSNALSFGAALLLIGVQKRLGMGKVQTNIRTNNSEQFEGAPHENVGFRGKKGQKVHPNFATNIAMEFSLPYFLRPQVETMQRNPFY